MKTATMRKIVKIDEEKCDGCGLCVPSCAEGAIKIIDGKARLVADNFCDGLGNCLGECPRGAITIEERVAKAFDEQAAHTAHAAQQPAPPAAHEAPNPHNQGGCPGSMLRKLTPIAPKPAQPVDGASSQLRHWPVQLALLPEKGAIWQDADVLLAADCVAFAMPDFHAKLLAGKTVAVACPKLDDSATYVEKLARIFSANAIASITVAHMEVPCCFGLARIVQAALERAGKASIPLTDITVGIDGKVMV